MAGFPGSGLKSIVAQREKSVWAGGVGGGHATDGNSCWASFQNKKDLDEQRFMGFSFPVLVTFQSMERKMCIELLSSGYKSYLPKEGS